MEFQPWSPPNGWPLAEVAQKQGWQSVSVMGVTAAVGSHGKVYVEGPTTAEVIQAISDALGLL